MKALDFHTHAFPDFLAPRALAAVQAKAVLQRAHLDGTVADLLRSMDRAGIDVSVVACIATAPDQFASILRWCGEIASDRIVPFPSVHPHAAHAVEQVRQVADAGFKGLKLHPLYQDFDVLEPRALRVYEAVTEAGLVLLFHSGDDLAFLGDHRCLPATMLRIRNHAPGLRMVLSHLGGFWQATNFIEHGLGSDVWIETSHTIPKEPSETFTRVCREHGRVMFGTDSPWLDQKTEIDKLKNALDDPALLEDVLWNHAARLLGIDH